MASPICVQCGHPKWSHCCVSGKCDAMVLTNPRQIVTANGFIETEHDKVECGCLKFTPLPAPADELS